ncbi:MAG: hypothetical protein H0U52_03585 [Chloroflexi bacterium]|nr:hypothetical protein [Chloroflexota bacterium]
MSLRLAGTSLVVEFDGASGAIKSIRNTVSGLDLISRSLAGPPFRIDLKGLRSLESFHEFISEPQADGLRLSWTVGHGIMLTSHVTMRGEDISFRIEATNTGDATIDRIEYPILRGIGRLGGKGQDELAHTHGTGMLFHDPLDLFDIDTENKRRLRFSPYPEGFSGSTMQFIAYYGRGRGGFLIGTEDGTKSVKWLTFFKDREGLTSSVIHKAGVPRPGAGFVPDYAIVVAPLARGTWYEACDRYRSWVTEQTWAQPGPRSRWLREEVGVCTFGINARHDRSAWLDEIHRMAGVPVFHVLGPNWAHYGHDYHNNLPRGRADWFPAVFNDKNLSMIRRNGDFWAPFEFDLLCDHSPGFDDPVLESRLVIDTDELGMSDPGLSRFPFMCAGTTYWHDFHVERDELLVAQHDPDALYYDISVSNLMLQCLAQGHLHPPGAGTAIADAFAAMYRDTSSAMARAKGDHVPAGTEVISEIFISQFEYYQARGEAGPYAPFEVAPFRDWILEGRAEKIPLFTYVFGPRAPLRMDGWAKLSPEAGDLFYWTAAQVLLNGGLLQLNYEFSGLEDLGDLADDSEQHYYRFDQRKLMIDPAKAAFVGEVARTRTGPANKFLARGAMSAAPGVDAPLVSLRYHAYNIGKGDPLYDTQGAMTVPSALASAWELEGTAIWLVANLLNEAQEVRVDGKRVELAGRQIRLIEP